MRCHMAGFKHNNLQLLNGPVWQSAGSIHVASRLDDGADAVWGTQIA